MHNSSKNVSFWTMRHYLCMHAHHTSEVTNLRGSITHVAIYSYVYIPCRYDLWTYHLSWFNPSKSSCLDSLWLYHSYTLVMQSALFGQFYQKSFLPWNYSVYFLLLVRTWSRQDIRDQTEFKQWAMELYRSELKWNTETKKQFTTGRVMKV